MLTFVGAVNETPMGFFRTNTAVDISFDASGAFGGGTVALEMADEFGDNFAAAPETPLVLSAAGRSRVTLPRGLFRLTPADSSDPTAITVLVADEAARGAVALVEEIDAPA